MNGPAAYYKAQSFNQEEILTKHAPLVKRIAYHLLGRLPASVEADDLIQVGMLGLLDAIRQYDPSQGASFETYAGIRIRGAMLDEIRRSDWAPRSVHRKAREVAQVLVELEHRLGREVSDSDVAQALGIALDEYYEILNDSNGAKILSLSAFGESEDDTEHDVADKISDPISSIEKKAFVRSLTQAISSLPERERLVLSLYYDDELNLREIGQVLGVSESRVSQIHSQAVIRLQGRLRDWS
jgi:RNA polymerase sigma factor FliA